MDKPESALKPNDESLRIKIESDTETMKETLHLNESTPLIDKETGRMPPLAMPENDPDALEIPHIDAPDGIDEFADEKGDEGIIDLSNRAGMPFPYSPGFGPNSIVPGNPESIPDLNMYQNKKTVAQGMMDLALFSANANQLRYVLESSSSHPYFYPGLVLISISLIFQVGVGVGLLWNTKYDVKEEKEIHLANKVNNFTVVGIFLVTVINVFISAFGTTAGPPAVAVVVASAP